MNILNLPVPGAVAGALGQVLQFREGPPLNLTLQANFAPGSGGTSVDAWVQTSIDGGNTWVDIANFNFTTSAAKAIFNLSALASRTTQVTPTDGTLAPNTAQDGIIGNLVRTKYTVVGTYTGASVSIDAVTRSKLIPQS